MAREEVVAQIREPDERERMRRARAFSMAKAEASGAKEEILAQAKREAELHILQHLFERRVQRPLLANELVALEEKLQQLGVYRLSDVFVELATEQFSSWIFEPAAKQGAELHAQRFRR